MIRYFPDLVARYKANQMHGEELRLFTIEICEQLMAFKDIFQGFLEKKNSIRKINDLMNTLVHRESLLFVYLSSFDGLSALFYEYQYLLDIYEYELGLPLWERNIDPDKAETAVKILLQKVADTPFPSIE